MPGGPSGHYAPLFDIIAKSVIDKSCSGASPKEQVFIGESNLPADLKAFFKGFSQAVEGENIEKILGYYSDDFLHSARNKSGLRGFYRLLTAGIDKFKLKIDQCRIIGNTATISGEFETNMGPSTLTITNLIKENGFWKWYGNQKSK